MAKTLKKTNGKSRFWEGRGVQDAAKVGQVPPKMGPSWAKLGLSWHLEATLARRWPKMVKMTWKMRLQRPKMRCKKQIYSIASRIPPGRVIEESRG